jgi:exosortase/archaeosortase family protein
VGTEVTAPGCVANVIDMCAGLGVAGAYIVIVLAFPASWKSRLAGVALGYPAVFLINQLRIVVLFLIAYNRLDILDTVHYYYSQAFVIFATVGVWLFWLSVIPSHGSKAAQIAPR